MACSPKINLATVSVLASQKGRKTCDEKAAQPEQIIRKPRQADTKLAAGASDPRICKEELGVSEATFHRWSNQYGGMKADAIKWLKQLEKENA